MSGKLPIYYCDSCIYLAWICNEVSAYGQPAIDAIVELISDNFQKKNVLITSSITFTEVLSTKITADQERKFQRCFRTADHIMHDVDPAIALKARRFREQCSTIATGKNLTTPDAIHLATASTYKADAFLTFDNGGNDKRSLGLLDLNGTFQIDGLKVRKPVIVNPTLFTLPTEPQQ